MCVGFQLLIFKLCLRFRAYGLGFEALKSYGVRVQDDLCKDAQVPYLFRNARMTHFLQCFESASGKTRCLAVIPQYIYNIILYIYTIHNINMYTYVYIYNYIYIISYIYNIIYI